MGGSAADTPATPDFLRASDADRDHAVDKLRQEFVEDLRIENMSVSRLHAQLNRAGDGWLLNDLGSHNGTRVNGWLVREPVPVRAGDLVQFGSATFIIQTPSQDQPGEPDGQSPREGGPGMRPR